MMTTDPVCGMPVDSSRAVAHHEGGSTFHFCSEFCKRQFERHRQAYAEPQACLRSEVRWPELRVAYFSMEVAFESAIPTYAGGLGVLAGDHLRACADLRVPIVGVSLTHHMGYLSQRLDGGGQREETARWSPTGRLEQLPCTVEIEIEGRTVQVAAWRIDVIGSSGHAVPLILLDTDLGGNSPEDRQLTDHLYGGDDRYRLAQEAVLGIGGVRMLRALGCKGLATFHLNEGHAALAPLELLRTDTGDGENWDFEGVRRRCVFTTHTPIAAGHDRFDLGLVRRMFPRYIDDVVFRMLGGADRLNMTEMALNLSHFVNGVALRHREVASSMFPGYEIHQITNGVHSRTWTSAPFKELFDRFVPGWRNDPWMLRNATALPCAEIERAHSRAKATLLQIVRERNGRLLRPDVLTVGFARRATAYKRPALVFRDRERLRAIASRRPIQFVFAGKAHPKDGPGKEAIHSVLEAARELGEAVPVVYLENYDLDLSRSLVAGVDVWLNTPLRPLEASGTSGMKAAHNGVPSLGTLDGWWKEGHVEGVTGWSIGPAETVPQLEADSADAEDLYEKLEHTVLPTYYDARSVWTAVMQQSIALNASFFNAHRMAQQYATHAYDL